MLSALILSVSLLTPIEKLAATVKTPVSDRLALRAELIALLPPDGTTPRALAGRAAELVSELELLESIPMTPEFLSLGVSGAWALKAVGEPTEPQPPSTVVEAGLSPAVEILGVQQELDLAKQTSRGVVQFRVVDDDLSGSLELDAIAAIGGERGDTVNYVTTERKLQLPRVPSCCTVPAMMEALHASLSHDWLGDEGVRLGLQTTYLDESLRITRCTTRALAGSCAVHLRRSAGEDQLDESL